MRQPTLAEIEGDPRKPFVLFGLGYLGLVFVAFYVDFKIQKRRARKRREKLAQKEPER